MSWIVNDSVNTCNLVPTVKENTTKEILKTSEGHSKTDTQSTTDIKDMIKQLIIPLLMYMQIVMTTSCQ